MTNLLDVVITRSDVAACFVRVGLTWPDHSWIVAGLDLLMPQDHTTVVQTTRGWRSFNFDAFISDLHESTLLSEPPTDVDYLFDCYHRTLETLVDLHAPLKTVQVRADHTARWFDAECKPVKRETRKLERRHRKYGTTVNRLAWREQLSRQRKTVPEKAEGILSNANTKANWSKVKALMSPPVVANASPFSADDCAKHFVDKVAKIRASTANAPPPVITLRLVSSVLSSFHAVTVKEVTDLLAKLPGKHCCLDPAPTWLVKKAAADLAPVLSLLCNALKSSRLPES